MPNILHITASIRGDESVSRTLSSTIAEKLAADSGAEIVTRDLSANDIPFVDSDRFAANLAPYADRSEEQHALAAIADTMIDELKAADAVVIGVPVYNFTMPATLKAWADLVARAGSTFEYTETGSRGLLTGKKAWIAYASGGTAMGSEIDFLTPWLKFFLGFLGIEVAGIVAADGIMGEDGEEKIAQAKEQAAAVAA